MYLKQRLRFQDQFRKGDFATHDFLSSLFATLNEQDLQDFPAVYAARGKNLQSSQTVIVAANAIGVVQF
ncbi:hypothetical protein JQ616_17710 [Bradyrhizobium tropiciagri]|uniref:hypothetical protein n=1 Tax=Bradyrhizobium tropiciagri TaxID=312253 RepID=UPI001BADBD96|nr:hypothetical protein [Bradyrhizobium tropiciagri]MBR0896801.1 hypothetical protein [Bradyrhizobium tropiciagri]